MRFVPLAILLALGCREAPAPPTEVKVAAIQCSSRLGDVAANRAKITALVEEAARRGAKIIVLPEAAITGYLSQDLKRNWHLKGWPIEGVFEGVDPHGAAEPVPGPSTKHFCRLADRLDVYVTIPLVEVVDDTFYNTVCLASPEGRLVAHYRKLTPWPHPEKSWATPGDRGVSTYDTEYGRVGLAICFDIHTILERYEEHSLWTLLYPIAWVDETHPVRWFRQTLPMRIGAAGHHLVGANWSVDEEQPWAGYGYSTIIAKDGTVLAQAESRTGSEIVYATLPTG